MKIQHHQQQQQQHPPVGWPEHGPATLPTRNRLKSVIVPNGLQSEKTMKKMLLWQPRRKRCLTGHMQLQFVVEFHCYLHRWCSPWRTMRRLGCPHRQHWLAPLASMDPQNMRASVENCSIVMPIPARRKTWTAMDARGDCCYCEKCLSYLMMTMMTSKKTCNGLACPTLQSSSIHSWPIPISPLQRSVGTADKTR